MEILKYGKAICYSGYRKGQSPKTVAPTKEQIAEDLDILHKAGYDYIRMYDPNLHARRALEVIKEKDLPIKCMIGIDSDPESNNPNCGTEKQEYPAEQLEKNRIRNDGEVDRLIELVREFPDQVIAVSVGNENTPVWGAHMVSEDRLVEHARKLKANLDKPVTFCEGYLEWLTLDKLIREVDFISIHSYPYHNPVAPADALEFNKQHYYDMVRRHPDMQVIFTELGWSTSRVPLTIMQDGTARESVEVASRYIREVADWFEKEKIIGFVFEAFDELWKGDVPEASECNFGLYNEERQPKW